jgi:hypothetical protein
MENQLKSREVQSKIIWGIAIFGLAPLILQTIKPELVPFYVGLSLVSIREIVVRQVANEKKKTS